ncbi:uncharacterized protein LOC119791427 [Cyprinodon tularosa]|uniref:uncharacterized protein LOC119791427 n=1 Tax=Cyprinodon tularosa TaxID=77115 RepID=UPI0018E220C6|nr:uncharacterized protein LOC119791427 [Cyprinodon tularosa]
MASASESQSASDYLTEARDCLVGKLRNHSVILENLLQQKFLHDEEVSEIEAEKKPFEKDRNILDSVIRKGERACYHLLWIIYMISKRTKKKPASLLKNHDGAEAKKFDLDHWISCFPFKEDAEMDTNFLQGSSSCYRYQEKLKSKAKEKSKHFWEGGKRLFKEDKKPELSFIPLVLDTEAPPSKITTSKNMKSKLSRPDKLRTYIPRDKPKISPSDLLETGERFLLVGKPGIGNTALCHEILRLWSERDDKRLDYMFYFDMRENNVPLIRSEDLLQYIEPDEGKDEILEDMRSFSNLVTVILDGVTDISSVIKKLVEKDLLSDAKIIITCRPDDEEDLCLEDWLRVEVKGFSEGAIKTYLSKALGDDHQEVLSNVELVTLSYVPMYALMVAATVSSGDSQQPRTVTEIYINIVRFTLKINGNIKWKDLNKFIRTKRDEIMSLAEAAFYATQSKTVNLKELSCEDSCVLSFLNSLDEKVAPTETITVHTFLHYIMQEFFAALWPLKDPEKIRKVFQKSLTDEMKHMKHLIPFMCRLLNDTNPRLMSCLIPDLELMETSDWFLKEMIDTFCSEPNVDRLFQYRCLYESQSVKKCKYFLNKLDFHLDLSGENLDPYSCQAVAFIVTQSKEKKINLNLQDVTVADQGMDFKVLLRLDGNQLHLPVGGTEHLFERALMLIKGAKPKVEVWLYWRSGDQGLIQHEYLLEALSHISLIRFHRPQLQEQAEFFVNLFCAAAEREKQTGKKILDLLKPVWKYKTLPSNHLNRNKYQSDFLLDLYSQMKDSETKTGLSLLPSFQSVFQSAPPFWSIDLSKRKTSILLEVLKLQSEKKSLVLTGCSHEESEVQSFLDCLPHIDEFSFVSNGADESKQTRFIVNLFYEAAKREQLTGKKVVKPLASVCSYTFPVNEEDTFYYYDKEKHVDALHQCQFLLDLYSLVKDHKTKTGLSLLPSLQSVFQSAPPVWTIKLSERKTSILLEVLKLQSEKKPVKLTDCSHGESEVRSFLQCLPYISQLSFGFLASKDLAVLFFEAAKTEQQPGENMLKLLASVCSYTTFPLGESTLNDYYQSVLLLDLYSQLNDHETETGLSLLPSLQSVFQSAPPVWTIKLSERKTSILLEVLKLQSEKKLVKLTDCSHGESEVRSFLQCLPYISQLRIWFQTSNNSTQTNFLVNLLCAAAERDELRGEKTVELVASGLGYERFSLKRNHSYLQTIERFHLKEKEDEYRLVLLLHLYSQMKEHETETGLSLLPSLQSVFQSAPPVWTIKLSERKTSILLEVLKLQSEKKPVKLTGCSHGESEVWSFLQCLPYISQLRFDHWSSDPDEQIRLLANLFCEAAKTEQDTGEKMVEQLASVCSYNFTVTNEDTCYEFDEEKHVEYQCRCHFLLELYSQMKNHGTKTCLSLLPSLQSVFQSAPAVWTINLSERKTSILLEVLKLQSEKKPMELTGCSLEEDEVRSFLQCLPYISELRFYLWNSALHIKNTFLLRLFSTAVKTEQETGEKMLELLLNVFPNGAYPFNRRFNVNPDDDSDVKDNSDFLLDLYSQIKDCETKTGLSLIPSLQSVFQSAPAELIIDLSERKASILLEVLKFQSKKKQVELRNCSYDDYSDLKSFLQCLPYISKFRFAPVCFNPPEQIRFLVNLLIAAAKLEQETGDKVMDMLVSVCTFEVSSCEQDTDQDFYCEDYSEDEDQEEHVADYRQSDFLLDLYSQVKDSETERGLSLLPSLQSVFKSGPPVWTINLSERKTSILLEVLKLQSEKKAVKLTGCSHGESEVRSFLQCLPYISQLSLESQRSFFLKQTGLLVCLFCAAAERELQTGEKMVELLASLCRYETFPLEEKYGDYKYRLSFLLDWYSQMKDCEITTCLSVLPSLQSVFQSSSLVWTIKLSERKTSILLEVLKLQSEKKPVELTDCSHGESEVRSFVRCLPYISQLRLDLKSLTPPEQIRFLVNLFCAAAEREQQTR